MQYDPPLIEARLIRRYKRFLADVELAGGEQITVSVPNTGSMMGLTAPGSRVWLTTHTSATRKYRHALEIVEAAGTLVGINTGIANRLTEEAIAAGIAGDLASYATLRREQRYGVNSRIDILLEDEGRPACYVEVKNVHMLRTPGLAEFPDTVTARGAKHLDEMARMVEAGARAVMVYLIQREDCERFALCADLDPTYTRAFERARAAGVEAMAIRCHISPTDILPQSTIPVAA